MILDMKRGIFRHGLFKTFLTQGILKPIFRPLLYTKEDLIHSDFCRVLNRFAIEINRKFRNDKKLLVSFWLSLVPKDFFEEIFIEDETGEAYFDVVKNATQINGEECAYLTQAYVLWSLQQMLLNNKEFKDAMGFSIDEMEDVTNVILGIDNKIIKHLNYFRHKLGVEEPDPRDWCLVYVWVISNTLIRDEKIFKNTLQDDDVFKKMNLTTFEARFFAHVKQVTLQLSRR